MSFETIDFTTGLEVRVKQPTESRLYRMNFTNLLVGTILSAITSVVSVKQDKVVGSINVTISNQSVSDEYIEFRVAGGTAGENYKITAIVVDAAGNTLEGEGMLYVRDV